MDSTTQRRPGSGGFRRSRLLALGGVCAAAAATFAISGSAAAAPGASGMVPGTPCHVGTAACVQLGKDGFNGKAWFIRDKRVVRGPVPVATGGPGKDTSIGKFPVTIKDVDHYSSETRDAEGNPSAMPYSVFFGKKGEAFHGGGRPTARTAGCIRMRSGDDAYFFNNLQKGDTVEIVSRTAGSAPADDGPVFGDRNDSRDDNDRRRGDNDDDNRDSGLGGLLGGL